MERFLPYWHDSIVPIRQGKRVIIVAHGNSLRALVKHLDNVFNEEIPELNIPTGVPLVYQFDNDLKPISHRYLADVSELEKALKKVTDQGKAEG